MGDVLDRYTVLTDMWWIYGRYMYVVEGWLQFVPGSGL